MKNIKVEWCENFIKSAFAKIPFENGKDLTYEEIEDIAKKYSARSLWYLWQHTKRHSKWLSRSK